MNKFNVKTHKCIRVVQRDRVWGWWWPNSAGTGTADCWRTVWTLVLGNEGKCLAAGCSREVPLEAPRAKRNRDTARDPGTKTVAVQRHGV